MKSVLIHLDDWHFEELKEKKGGASWKKALIWGCFELEKRSLTAKKIVAKSRKQKNY